MWILGVLNVTQSNCVTLTLLIFQGFSGLM